MKMWLQRSYRRIYGERYFPAFGLLDSENTPRYTKAIRKRANLIKSITYAKETQARGAYAETGSDS